MATMTSMTGWTLLLVSADDRLVRELRAQLEGNRLGRRIFDKISVTSLAVPEVEIEIGVLGHRRAGSGNEIEVAFPVRGSLGIGLAVVDLVHQRLGPLIGRELDPHIVLSRLCEVVINGFLR